MNALFAVDLLFGAKIGGEPVKDGVQLFIGKRRVHLVCGVHSECKRKPRISVEGVRPLLHVGGVADLDVFLE